MKIKDFSKIYFAILILHLITIYKQDYGVLYLISKPLLLFCLLSFWIHRSSLLYLKGKHFFSLALVGCLTGDVLLMLKTPEWLFYAGMGAFGIAHIMFFIFYVHQSISGISKAGFAVGAFITFIATGILYYLYNLSMPLKLAVYIYAFLFGLHLIWNGGVALIKSGGYLLAFSGATLFLISDMLLLWLKISDLQSPLSHISVMASYGLGVYLITTGIVKKESFA